MGILKHLPVHLLFLFSELVAAGVAIALDWCLRPWSLAKHHQGLNLLPRSTVIGTQGRIYGPDFWHPNWHRTEQDEVERSGIKPWQVEKFQESRAQGYRTGHRGTATSV